MLSDGPNSIRRLGRLMRRRANIMRRIGQLNRDFDAANNVDAELRINTEIARQNLFLSRVEARLAGTTRG